jgi:hypothetical protein
LFVTKNGKYFSRVQAMGGPAAVGSDPSMPEEPTWPGQYIIGKAEAYNTVSWFYSKLAWGTKLRDMPSKKDVWYELPSGKWGSLNQVLEQKNTSVKIKALHKAMYGYSKIPDTWIFNDFGPIAIRWFKDLNGNKILDGKEVLSGQMFHTTPADEADTKRGFSIHLVHSHGCIH